MGNILNKVRDKNATSVIGVIDEEYVEESPFGWDDTNQSKVSIIY